MYIPVLTCRTQQNYVSLCHHKTEKETEVTPKEYVSTRDTADLHTHFLRKSVIKCTLLLKHNNHASKILTYELYIPTLYNKVSYTVSCNCCSNISDRSGSGVVSICNITEL